MAGSFPIKQHDRRPSLLYTLPLPNSTKPVDLTGAVGVKFIMRAPGSAAAKVSAAVVVVQGVDPDTSAITNQGQVRYDWASGDTDTAGIFNGEFEVDWGTAGKQTCPDDGYLQVVVLADLG